MPDEQLTIGGVAPPDPDLRTAPREAVAAVADAGMSSALRAERVQMWKDAATVWLLSLMPGTEFIADDLVAAVGLPDHGQARNNVVGAWISAQARAGRIEFTGKMRKSERVIGHGNLLRVWRVT